MIKKVKCFAIAAAIVLCASALMSVDGTAASGSTDSALKTVWSLGRADGANGEFSNKPARAWMDGYDKKFGGGFDIAAGEKIKKDVFPGVQAGPGDGWGAGKSYPLRLHFKLDQVVSGGYSLTIGFSGVSDRSDPELEISVNGRASTKQIPRGMGEVALSFQSTGKTTTISSFISANDLKKGENTITLTIVGGGWAAYDFVKLESAADATKASVRINLVDAPPFLVKRGGALGHLIRADGVSLGKNADVVISAVVGGKEYSGKTTAKAGDFNVDMMVPEQAEKTTVSVKVAADGVPVFSSSVELAPVRHLTIYVIPHSHLDIGYPDLQSNILIAQKRYLEQALDLIDDTGGEKEAAKRSAPLIMNYEKNPKIAPMKWVAEISWLQWLLMKGIGPYEEYGKWMPETPLTRSAPDSFYKESLGLRNIAYKAEVKSTAPKGDAINDRRAVDGSPMGWLTLGAARGARVELSFAAPQKLAYVAVRNGRETEENPIRYVRVKTFFKDGTSDGRIVGPLGANRERFLVSVTAKPVSKFSVEVVSAAYDERPASFMDIEAWQRVDPRETIDRTLKAMRDGRLELTGMYMNFLTQLTPTEWLIRSFLRSNEVARAAGVKLDTALMTDVPGFTFALPDVLSGAGIKYFYPALNADHAGGCLTGIPRAFIWEGPGGGKIIVFHSFGSYNEGFEYGFPRGVDVVEKLLPNFLNKLGGEGYPYDLAALRTLGDITDDGPTGERLPEVVGEWNRRWAYPRVVIGTPSEFFKKFDVKYRSALPLLKGDWTSSWEDGEGSSAMETILVRGAHRNLLFENAFGAVQQRLLGSSPKLKAELVEAEEGVYLYDEHTWGADMSISSPYSLQTTGQWHLKKMPMWGAANNIARAKALLEPVAGRFAPGPKRGGRIVAIMNSYGAARGGLIELPYGVSTGGTKVYDIVTGKEIGSVDAGNNLLFVAPEAPAMGIRYFEVVSGKGKTAKTAAGATYKNGKFENSLYKITIDEKACRILSVYDKTTQHELIDSGNGYAMNEFIYVTGKVEPKQSRMNCVAVKPGDSNAVYGEFRFVGNSKYFPRIEQIVRVYNKVNKIEFINKFDKMETLSKEGVYFAFPFNVPGGETRLEMTGGMMATEKDQLPAAMRDWISMQDAAGVVSDDFSILFSTPDAPLVVPENIRVLTFQNKLERINNTLFSYVMNNYWHTNYLAEQGGSYTFRYAIAAANGRATDSDIIRFGRDVSDPLSAAWVKKSGGGSAGQISFISVSPANVRLLGVKEAEDGDGIVIRLQEMDGKAGKVKLLVDPLLKVTSAYRTNLIEDIQSKLPVAKKNGKLLVEDKIGALGMLTIKIK
ncbi:MAG: glycosyl hydrolase-related protein [bacterium]